MPVGARTRATTMPPKSRAREPDEALAALKTSLLVICPARINTVRPSMARSVMSARPTAMLTMTNPKTVMMNSACGSSMGVFRR